MAENKTQATQASVEAHLAAIDDETRQSDCRALVKLMTKVTKHKPVMWGASIVGFGSYHYKYESGREGDMCMTGFASRKGDISIYLNCGMPGEEKLFEKLGKHKRGKACLYVRKLEEIDVKVLEKLIAGSVSAVKKRYG